MSFRSTIFFLAALNCGVFSAHALELKEVTFLTPGAGKVVFSHSTHLNRKSTKSAAPSCKSCHAIDKKPKSHFTMADMRKGESCGKCHTGQQAFGIENCSNCHQVKEVTFRVKQTGPVFFSHKRHLKTMQCDACHSKLYSTGPHRVVSMAQMEKGESCGACHNGTKAFAIEKCGGCHPTPREIVFKVRETGPTIFHHEEHAASFNCAACHDKLYVIGAKKHLPMAAMEKGKSCGACHNKKEAFAINSCQKCHPVKEIHFKVEGAGNVKFSHSAHLGMYSCRDCHSAIFPAKISTRAVSMSEMEKGKSCGACHDGKTAFSVKEKCDSCHASG